MTFDEIEKAVGQHLTGMSSCPPVAWQNKDASPALPYIEFRHVPNTVTDDTIDGTGIMHQGLFLLTVVVARDKFTTQANTIAQAIATRFPKALRLTAGSGKVLINAPPSLGAGFVDGVYWRQPVRLSYLTEV